MQVSLILDKYGSTKKGNLHSIVAKKKEKKLNKIQSRQWGKRGFQFSGGSTVSCCKERIKFLYWRPSEKTTLKLKTTNPIQGCITKFCLKKKKIKSLWKAARMLFAYGDVCIYLFPHKRTFGSISTFLDQIWFLFIEIDLSHNFSANYSQVTLTIQ